MDVVLPIVTFAAAVVGVLLGAWLTRLNEKKATTERLLIEAVNDALAAIAAVANAHDSLVAQASYASAMSRIGLHAPPEVVRAFRVFQNDATTRTADGRQRLLTALRITRDALGQGQANEDDLAVLLFGPGPRPGGSISSDSR
jgi:hypothetical protein